MIVTPQQIRDEIEALWPVLHPVILFDGDYWKPPLRNLERLKAESRVHTMQFIRKNGFCDCDNFALQFHAEVRRKRYYSWVKGNLPEDQMYPVPIGSVWGDMFRGAERNHFANICVCQEGVYLADLTPGENRIWKADPEKDNVLWISMQ